MIKIIKVNLLLLLSIDLINLNIIIPVNTFHHFLCPYKFEMNITKFQSDDRTDMWLINGCQVIEKKLEWIVSLLVKYALF